MAEKMRFSIVAPNLNEMPYIKNLFLDSLSNQTFKDFEIIIIDGGSTDESIDAIESYQERLNVKVLIDKTRNIGYIRNVGCKVAAGEILLNTSTDVWFDPSFLKRLDLFYEEHPKLCALGGKTLPLGSHVPIISRLGYGAFDLLRFLMTCRFMPIKKLRPTGNFLSIKKSVFDEVGGYPEVRINEDGLLGYKLDRYWLREKHKSCIFSLKFAIHHHVKRFEKRGGITGIFFYLYVFGLIFPFLKPLLDPIERISGEKFSTRSDLK